jgi:hypothetical protein
MRAILINPADRTVTEIQIGPDYKEIYKVIDCECFTCPVSFENEDAMYCDDEGLFKEQEGGIMMKDWAYPILGKILILGTDIETGESQDAKSDIKELERQIRWINKATAERYRSQFN